MKSLFFVLLSLCSSTALYQCTDGNTKIAQWGCGSRIKFSNQPASEWQHLPVTKQWFSPDWPTTPVVGPIRSACVYHWAIMGYSMPQATWDVCDVRTFWSESAAATRAANSIAFYFMVTLFHCGPQKAGPMTATHRGGVFDNYNLAGFVAGLMFAPEFSSTYAQGAGMTHSYGPTMEYLSSKSLGPTAVVGSAFTNDPTAMTLFGMAIQPLVNAQFIAAGVTLQGEIMPDTDLLMPDKFGGGLFAMFVIYGVVNACLFLWSFHVLYKMRANILSPAALVVIFEGLAACPLRFIRHIFYDPGNDFKPGVIQLLYWFSSPGADTIFSTLSSLTLTGIYLLVSIGSAGSRPALKVVIWLSVFVAGVVVTVLIFYYINDLTVLNTELPFIDAGNVGGILDLPVAFDAFADMTIKFNAVRLVGNLCMLVVIAVLLIITCSLLIKLAQASKMASSGKATQMMKWMIPNTIFLIGYAVFNFFLTNPDQNSSKVNQTLVGVCSVGSGFCSAAAAFFQIGVFAQGSSSSTSSDTERNGAARQHPKPGTAGRPEA